MGILSLVLKLPLGNHLPAKLLLGQNFQQFMVRRAHPTQTLNLELLNNGTLDVAQVLIVG